MNIKERQCDCAEFSRMVAENSLPIIYNENEKEYVLRGESVIATVRYCPFCGGRVCGSAGKELIPKFIKISPDETERLIAMFDGIKTLDEAVSLFGTPQSEAATLTYSNLSKEANVLALVIDNKWQGIAVSAKA